MDQKLINQFHYRLEIPVKFEPRNLKKFTMEHTYYDSELIDQDIKDWLAISDIYISWSECFILDPNRRSSWDIHIDNALTDSEQIKMNFVYCDTTSSMNWFKLKEGRKTLLATTSIGSKYYRAEDADCDLVYSAEIGKPSIVNASILHTISPVTSIRHCYSFSMCRISTNQFLTWNDATEIFGDFIVGN